MHPYLWASKEKHSSCTNFAFVHPAIEFNAMFAMFSTQYMISWIALELRCLLLLLLFHFFGVVCCSCILFFSLAHSSLQNSSETVCCLCLFYFVVHVAQIIWCIHNVCITCSIAHSKGDELIWKRAQELEASLKWAFCMKMQEINCIIWAAKQKK